ncbi:hypothetical protein DPEC_G00121800 [Dallia pectoralis]|uniref:Uncharacterized protein n=1 Tax=Dallia pectoralis TaxID=75939 RepID=A0ACC2GQV1_DALPE|nr:hypothetical protein DPEC_G00121800 [Dallia pectoralis]
MMVYWVMRRPDRHGQRAGRGGEIGQAGFRRAGTQARKAQSRVGEQRRERGDLVSGFILHRLVRTQDPEQRWVINASPGDSIDFITLFLDSADTALYCG